MLPTSLLRAVVRTLPFLVWMGWSSVEEPESSQAGPATGEREVEVAPLLEAALPGSPSPRVHFTASANSPSDTDTAPDGPDLFAAVLPSGARQVVDPGLRVTPSHLLNSLQKSPVRTRGPPSLG